MEIRTKLWIESDGEPVFGRGRVMLLRAIDTHGSINSASRDINISYRKAWGYIKAMEDRLGIPLVIRQAGGKNGGGASLTPEARSLIAKYVELEGQLREMADRRFGDIFSQ